MVVVVLLVMAWGLQRRLIYFPDRTKPPPAAVVVPDATDVDLRTDDGLALGAWYMPAADPDRQMTVLVAPGNGGNREGRAPLARALARRGLGVLLFDYRGYGGNEGNPTEPGLALDVRAARQFLLGQQVPANRILYFGESLGTAVVTELATEHPPAGMLLRSPFVDLASMASVHYPFLPARALLRDRFPVADQLARVDVPTTVVYGGADSIVPPRQSRAVAEAAGRLQQLVEVDGADHNGRALLDGDLLITAVVELAERAAGSPDAGDPRRRPAPRDRCCPRQ